MDTQTILYSTEAEVQSFGISVPCWIEPDIDATQVAAILQGGCESGAYMPAVTYHSALRTMDQYGDDVLQYIEDTFGDSYPRHDHGASWAGIACHYLSMAVELWASEIADELARSIEAASPDDDPDGHDYDGGPAVQVAYNEATGAIGRMGAAETLAWDRITDDPGNTVERIDSLTGWSMSPLAGVDAVAIYRVTDEDGAVTYYVRGEG
jgi:hypothetical protein